MCERERAAVVVVSAISIVADSLRLVDAMMAMKMKMMMGVDHHDDEDEGGDDRKRRVRHESKEDGKKRKEEGQMK